VARLSGALFLALVLSTAARAHADGGSAGAASPTTSECVSLNEKAGPLQKAGKLVEAHAGLVRCSASSCPAVVRDDCAKEALAVEDAIPTIVFEARDGAGNDRSDVHLSVDGEARADRLTGVALEVDPGDHSFRFEAAGLPPLEKHFVIHAGEKNRREQIVIGPVKATAGTTPPPPPPPGDHRAGGGALRPLGLVASGVGVVGMGVGGVLGLLARSKWNQAVTDCGAGCPADAPARNEASSAHTFATVSNVAFAAGGALTLTGLVLFIAAPRGEKTTAAGALVRPSRFARFAPFFGQGTLGMAATGSLP
jgi:hypothetical protein